MRAREKANHAALKASQQQARKAKYQHHKLIKNPKKGTKNTSRSRSTKNNKDKQVVEARGHDEVASAPLVSFSRSGRAIKTPNRFL